MILNIFRVCMFDLLYIKEVFATIFSSIRYTNWRTNAVTGKLDDNGDLIPDAAQGLANNYIWVRLGDDRTAVPMLSKIRSEPGIDVIVAFDRLYGKDVVVEVDLERSPIQNAAAYNVPRLPAAMSTPISARDLVPGGVFADASGGLRVRIGSYWHEGGYYADTAASLLVPTATSGMKSLAVVGVNRVTNAVTYALTADHATAYTLIANGAPTAQAVSDILVVVTANPHIDWRGAVELKNGDAEVNPAKIVPLNWLKSAMVGADGVDAGVAGLVPAPAATDNDRVLLGDGSWAFRHLTSTTATLLTIASGVVTAPATTCFITIAAQTGTADDLDTATVIGAPRIILLQADTGDTIAVKHNTGNIKLNGGADFSLSGDKTLALFWDGTNLADVGAGGSASSSTLPAFGAGIVKTLASGVATAGSDRHLIIAAESGTADDLIEVSGLSAGDEVILRADAGDTITVKHNDAGATDKIILYGAADMILSGDKTVKLFKSASGKVVQYVDDSTTGSAPSTGKYITYGYDSTNTAEKAIPAWEFHSDMEPASPNAADDEFAGSSLGGSWSWVNQGSASAAVAKSRLLLTVPSTSTGNIRGIFRTYPGQSTWEAQITGWSSTPAWSGANNYNIGIARRDSTTGRIEMFSFAWNAGSNVLLMLCDRWTSPTVFSATVASFQLARQTFGSFYLQLVDDNTNVALKWSIDGVNWTQLTSFTRAAFLASADQIGLTVFTQQNGGNIYLQSDWMRRTA
ncbi:MAG: hypothetical protein IPK17_38455 [Chloroflexi bacterium]|uniref:hypothetical protein n=1 Tax=Candidatus Flexifilum breve TaxID=3140694 RepID=UPI003134F1EF|nr:hypothetical protein [Chloroflexota bacterium]